MRCIVLARCRMGVSYLVAVVLLVMVSVSVSVVVYWYVSDLSSRTSGSGERFSGRFLVEGVDASGGFRLEVRVTNSVGTVLSDYPVRIVLDGGNFGDWSLLSGNSVFFTLDPLGSNKLYYWVEMLDTVGKKAVFWVRVPSIPASGSVSIYMWYGFVGGADSSYNDASKVFTFYDGFDSLNTGVWDSSSLGDHVLSHGTLMIAEGGLGLQSALPYNLEDGYCAESRAMMNEHTSTHYGGTLPELSSSKFTRSGNGGSDATVFMMRAPGSGATNIQYWIGSGSTSSYDVASGATAYNARDNVWYVNSVCIHGSTLKLMKDYSLIATESVSWAKPIHYISIGAFHGDPGYEIKNTTYDWVRIRKYVDPEPTVVLGGKMPITTYTIYVRNTGKTKLTLDTIYILNLTTGSPIKTLESLERVVKPGEMAQIVATVAGGPAYNVKVVVVTKAGLRAEYTLLPS